MWMKLRWDGDGSIGASGEEFQMRHDAEGFGLGEQEPSIATDGERCHEYIIYGLASQTDYRAMSWLAEPSLR